MLGWTGARSTGVLSTAGKLFDFGAVRNTAVGGVIGLGGPFGFEDCVRKLHCVG